MRSSQPERVLLRQHLAQFFQKDGNLWLLGVPGSGRKHVIEGAAKDIQGIVLHLDCLRATDQYRFLTLLTQSFLKGFGDHEASLAWVGQYLGHHHVQIDPRTKQLSVLFSADRFADEDLQQVLDLPQRIAECKQQRVVVFLSNFLHLNSWDRDEQWQQLLRQRLDHLPDANYVLGYGLGNHPHSPPATTDEVITLKPLLADQIETWFLGRFQFTDRGLREIIEVVQGHVSTAIALAHRLPKVQALTEADIRDALAGLLEDLSFTFEMLLMQLPAIQCRVLETLAIYPTIHPQSHEYTQKHALPRGGSLQGALLALVKKDLLYGSDQLGEDHKPLAYQFCQPLLGLWIRRYLA